MKKDTMLDMQEALDSPDSSIHVQNGESDFGRFYRMDVPFGLTLEYCSGVDAEDYVNIVTLSFDKAVLYQETYTQKNYSYAKGAPHFHDFFEFVVVLEGNIIQKIEGKDYLYTAGSCCLINRSLRHAEHYPAAAKVLYIGISPAFVTGLFDAAQNSFFSGEKTFFDSDIYRFITADLNDPGRRAYLDFLPAYQNHQHAARLHTLAEAMVQTLLYPQFGANFRLCGLLCSFLTDLCSPQSYHCTNIRLDSGSDFLLFSRITRLFEESDGRMTRAQLEQFLNYSGDYLNRIVNKYADMCLYDYGMSFCLKKAAQYLTETNDSVSAIAARLKFINHTHFYALFREKYGVTPKEYRKLHT